MEAADDISYCIADLEDAVDRRILTQNELLAALREADEGGYMADLLDEALASGRGFFPHFRQHLTRDLVALAAHTYVAEHDQILSGAYPQALLHGQAPAARVLDTLKRVARELVFMRPEVEALELEGYAALRGVLSTYACLLALPAPPQGVSTGGGEPGSPFRKGERAGVVLPGAAAARLCERHDGYLCAGGVPAVVRDLTEPLFGRIPPGRDIA